LLEERIEGGEVRVNGVVATIGSSVRSGDRVELDGKAFMAVTTEPEETQVLIYHKPEGEVTTTDDPEGRPTVFENLPRLRTARWVSIGRLDINTTGLLLLTTDGELANALMHPSTEVVREYVCRIHGPVGEDMLERLRAGVELDDGPARFDDIAVINLGENHSWLRVTLTEGRNREVRRLWESQGVQVSRLKRIRYGSVELPRELRRGHSRVLPPETYRALRTECGLSEAPQTLTLQAVIGVRRAAKTVNEFKPSGRAKSSFDLHGSDEARELRAFDFVRDERTAGQRPGKSRFAKKSGPGGPRRARGAAAPGGYSENPAATRSWAPGGAPAGDPQRRKHKRPGGKPGQPAMPFGFPSDHAYARRDEPGGNRAPSRGPRRDDVGNRAPGRSDNGNRAPGRPDGGNRGPGRSDGGNRGPGRPDGGNRPPGNRGPARPDAGNRGPRRDDGGNRAAPRPDNGNRGPARPDGGNRPPRRTPPGGGRGRPRG
jgi:23S rRNA pseudouridine2605 synthase